LGVNEERSVSREVFEISLPAIGLFEVVLAFQGGLSLSVRFEVAFCLGPIITFNLTILGGL
jgi:hypothetical protein